MIFHRQRGVIYFRIFGWGLWWGTYALWRPFFSERSGHRKPLLKTKNWRVFLLKPGF